MTPPLWYELTGPPQAPVLVLGGSLGTTTRMWRQQLPVLHQRFRVLRFDHLGHGRSAVPAGPYRIEQLGAHLLATLAAAGVRQASYCGLSLGGMLGLWLAATRPELVDRLVVMCSSAYLPPEGAWLQRAEAVRRNGTGSVASAVLARWFTPDFLETRPATVAGFAAELAATPAEGYAGCCEAIAAMDLRGMLGSVTAPTLVISGAEDPATPPEHGRAVATGIAAAGGGTATHVVVEQAAHLANVEQSGVVTALLMDHLAAGPGGAAGGDRGAGY